MGPGLTYTRCAAEVRGVANLAEASEGAHGVDALAIGAEVWHHLTFINICGPRTQHAQHKTKTEVNM